MNSKGQAWYADFAIGLLLFFFTLVIYIGYNDNFQKQNMGELNNMITDARAVSSSLILSGYPSDWNSSTVVRIGISDDQRLNATKLLRFSALNYTLTKRIFATPYEYFVFFANNKGEVLNVSGVCGVGSPLVNVSYGAVQGTCNPINLTGISLKNVVKTERYLVYNSSVAKMGVYLWQ